jgi:hypothetical protein
MQGMSVCIMEEGVEEGSGYERVPMKRRFCEGD